MDGGWWRVGGGVVREAEVGEGGGWLGWVGLGWMDGVGG